jgi:alpha-D-ribose 1-methylphosphonate 5-triphosphate synthase subunit PhnG
MLDTPLSDMHALRPRWMAVLARSTQDDLKHYFDQNGGLPDHHIMKAAETGTVMIEGRAGGTGQRFNTGETTVTRCVVRLGSHMGFSYALGRDKYHALYAAILDALLQDPAHHHAVMDAVIKPLQERQAQVRLERSRKAATTKVEFFTLVRGDG